MLLLNLLRLRSPWAAPEQPTVAEIWTDLQGFDFNKGRADGWFERRLQEEHGWSPDFASDVTEEYRRFLLICVVLLRRGKMPVPSLAVDEAWHQHILCTRSYWKDLCKDTIRTILHHDPGDGKPGSELAFQQAYQQTLQIYRELFHEKPPVNIWGDS